MRWILGLSFLSVAVWALFPDKYEGNETPISRSGAFISTLIAFFIAEIGDKTQVATIALAAAYSSRAAVVTGTTAGMLAANLPVVLLGNRFAPATAISLMLGPR